jgi:hypothetical protein
VSPTDLFLLILAGAAGVALGLIVIAFSLAVAYIAGAALLRTLVKGNGP